MKKRTLEDEIRRIKSLNKKVITELYAEDNDDYLYDPDYYETDTKDEKDNEDFQDDMISWPDQDQTDDNIDVTNEPEDEVSSEHFDDTKTGEWFDLLTKGDLAPELIDEPVLQALIKDRIVKPTADFGDGDRVFGFANLPSMDEPTRDYSTLNIKDAGRSIINNFDNFHIYVNNVKDEMGSKTKESYRYPTDNPQGNGRNNWESFGKNSLADFNTKF